MTTPEAHFKYNAHSDIKRGREDVLDAILSDPAALDKFDLDYEVWAHFNLLRMGKLLRLLQNVKRNNPPNAEGLRKALRSRIGHMVEELWCGRLEDWIDEEYSKIDLPELARLEQPEHIYIDSSGIDESMRQLREIAGGRK